MAAIGDLSNPNIAPGTLLIVPGGYSEFTDWRTPTITRADPASAVNVGPGACTQAYDGVSGTLNFAWPTQSHTLSGFDYDPSANHFGIDIAGSMGEEIHAADNGVVVYAGWNDWGYGNMVVIDHGSGWQTYYAHLSTVTVGCGDEVYLGDVIGTMGDTGNADGVHLHFEIRNDEIGRINPWDLLR
jgi:murein DD-endopeptidase MepM/ murein hydrolase activator NlpD